MTTNYILTELVALLRSPLRIPHAQIVAFIIGLKASPYVDIVHVDPTLDAQAWQLFTERPDMVKWDLDNKKPMKGKMISRVLELIEALESEDLV